jgi:hypothetical protein
MDLDRDLLKSDYIVEKARANDYYAQNIYAALCNMRWCRIIGDKAQDTIDILKDELWSCSWRSSGGIVAQICGKGGYMDWYCSGMGGLNAGYDPDGDESFETWQARTKYVPEGLVTEEIANDFKQLGWVPVPWDDEKSS